MGILWEHSAKFLLFKQQTKKIGHCSIQLANNSVLLSNMMSAFPWRKSADYRYNPSRHLIAMAKANGRPADPLKNAAFGILILGDLERAFPPAKEYRVIDGAIAAQNMILAAHDAGLGSVWLGTWPQMDRVSRQRERFHIPDRYIPHSIIAFGYPEDDILCERDQFEPDKVHDEKWQWNTCMRGDDTIYHQSV